MKFDRKQRLDDFFFKTLKVGERYPNLATLMKVVFTLSHGQASVERGFNDNNLVLKDNLKDNSIVARRFVKNYMSANGLKPRTVIINAKMIGSVKGAWRRYNEYIEAQKEKGKKKEKNDELVLIKNARSTLQQQYEDIQESIQGLESKFVLHSMKAETANQMMYLIEGNALKRKSEEKAELLRTLQKRIGELDVKKMKFH